MGRSILKAEREEDRQRSDYLSDRLRQNRLKDLIDTKDQQKQKRLSQELEKQKRILEQERQEEQRRLQALKMAEKERQILEAKRHRFEAIASQSRDKPKRPQPSIAPQN